VTNADAMHDYGHRPPSLFAQRPIVTGIAVGIVTLLPHGFLTPEASLGFAAIVIALIAGIYFGFAVMNGSPRGARIVWIMTMPALSLPMAIRFRRRDG
jgi:hypothetical protein